MVGSRPGTECGDPDQSLAMWPRPSCMTFQTWIFWGRGKGGGLYLLQNRHMEPGSRQEGGRAPSSLPRTCPSPGPSPAPPGSSPRTHTRADALTHAKLFPPQPASHAGPGGPSGSCTRGHFVLCGRHVIVPSKDTSSLLYM